MAVLELRIHDRSYQIACDDGQEDHLRNLAKQLHERVSDLAARMGGSVPDATLLAISSLMIMDELNEEQQANKQMRAQIGETSQSFEVAKAHELEINMAETINAIANDLENFADSIESN